MESFLERIAHVSQADPDRIAVRFGPRTLTYGELAAKTDRIAAALVERGIAAGSLLGVSMHRSDDMLCAVLGVLKAGCAYVPVDPAFPQDRRTYILETSRCAAVIADADVSVEHAAVLDLPSLLGGTSSRPAPAAEAESLAYVIFTSGSTGRPKGVMVPHRAVDNFLESMAERPGMTRDDVLLAVTTLSFDISVLELFLPLTVGARVVIAAEEDCANGERLMELMREHRVTVMQATPSTWRMLFEAGWTGNRDLKVLCGGEAATRDLVDKLAQCTASLWNMYGPTETTVWSSCGRLSAGDGPISLGTAIANTELYVLDERNEPVPEGGEGELYIGGLGVTQGYFGRPDLTAERYIDFPRFGGILYRTGDIVRRLENGELEYRHRADSQVKLRGYRIELGEIESVLNEQPEVIQAAVAIKKLDQEDCLAAYVVGEPAGLEPAQLRARLAERLPEYMLPQVFVRLDALPLTPNKKVDRKALPDPQATSRLGGPPPGAAAAQMSGTEQAVAEIWCSVIGLAAVGPEDDFYSIGGHSLLATRIWARVKSHFSIELPLKDVFTARTVRALAQRVDAGKSQDTAHVSIPVTSRMSAPLMSLAQQRFWYIDQITPQRTLFNLCAAWRLRGAFSVEALRQAFQGMIARHEILRTALVWDDEVPKQVIRPALRYELPEEDLSALAADEREPELMRRIHSRIEQEMQLDRDPLFDAMLYRLGPDEQVLFFMPHHVIWDGWSFDIFLAELKELYEAHIESRAPRLPELPIQYADYAVWHRDRLESAALAEQRAYWTAKLSGELPTLDLRTDRPRPMQFSNRGDTQHIRFDRAVVSALQSLAVECHTTINVVTLAIYFALLKRYTGQDDIIVGSPIQGRLTEETENLIGLFVNTLPIRVDLSGNPSFKELVGRVRVAALDAYEHQEIPFEVMVDMLEGQRDTSRTPVYQALFTFQETSDRSDRVGELVLSQIDLYNGTCPTDVSFWVKSNGQDLYGALEYNSDIFAQARAARFVRHLLAIGDAVAVDPAQPLSALRLLDDAEMAELDAWNDTAQEWSHATVLELIAARAAERPSATALVTAAETLTYEALDARVAALCGALLARPGTPGSIIALSLERSADMMVSMLAVLRAGAAYLPIDPSYPEERNRYVLEHSGAQLVLTDRANADLLSELGVETLVVDELTATAGASVRAPVVTPESRAYVIYTSGSTGRPKGVVIPHAALANFVQSVAVKPGIGKDDRVLGITTLSFDIHVLELLASLAAGAAVVLASAEEAGDGRDLARLLETQNISLMQATPSTWRLLREVDWAGDSGLKALVGGEAVPQDLVDWIEPRVEALWNMYGPTETTVWSSCERLRAGEAPLIGSPLHNTTLYVLDRESRRVPAGVVGELYIGGAGLATEYLHDAEKTADRFLALEATGERVYRTGDSVVQRYDGRFEYVGRMDNQVKVRGFRIELGEIEHAIEQMEGVAQAVAIVREDGAGDQRLVAYYVSKGAEVGTTDIRKALRKFLPPYMVPQYFVPLTAMPQTPNGKVARNELPAPAALEQALQEKVEPQTETEKKVAEMWRELIGVAGVGRHDNFFDIGGHSLLSMKLISQLRKTFGVDLPVRDVLFDDLAALCDKVDAGERRKSSGRLNRLLG